MLWKAASSSAASLGVKKKMKWLASLLYAGGERVAGLLLLRGKCGARLAIVEDHAALAWLGREEGKRSAEGLSCEVGNHAKPSKEAGNAGVEACEGELIGQ